MTLCEILHFIFILLHRKKNVRRKLNIFEKSLNDIHKYLYILYIAVDNI